MNTPLSQPGSPDGAYGIRGIYHLTTPVVHLLERTWTCTTSFGYAQETHFGYAQGALCYKQPSSITRFQGLGA